MSETHERMHWKVSRSKEIGQESPELKSNVGTFIAFVFSFCFSCPQLEAGEACNLEKPCKHRRNKIKMNSTQ